MKIIFNSPENECLSAYSPAPNWVGTSGKPIKDLTSTQLFEAMQELGKKDVPTGLKYKIVEDSDFPPEKTFRNAWVVDDSELTDGIGEKE